MWSLGLWSLGFKVCPGMYVQGFPEIRDSFLGVPILRMKMFCGPYWGPPALGSYQKESRRIKQN